MKQAREYQTLAINECITALEGSNDPVLLLSSVGSGKSYMIARILLHYVERGKRCLCLINNAELVRNNSATYKEEGGKAGIYCASLKQKNTTAPVIFGTSQSILAGIKKDIGKIKFDLIVCDEAHAINYTNSKSTFMKLFTKFYNNNPSLKVLGATGTDFRFKGNDIVGPECFFKKRVGNITTSKLINEGYLVQPNFEIDPNLLIDFSSITPRNGVFAQKELQKVVDANERLTYLICKQIQKIMTETNRVGCFIFATTVAHAREIYSYLPEHETGLILGETSEIERNIILTKARNKQLRYIVNVAILAVGVDVPVFDTAAYLRPTESLVLMVQTIGRVLRVAPNKTDALILDYAGNIERHQDWDDPILLEALKQTRDKDKDYDIKCPACHTMNTQHARRCIGTFNYKRCEYFFEWKDCHECKAQNDIASRHCRKCKSELIDPNDKLQLIRAKGYTELNVQNMEVRINSGSTWYILSAIYTHDRGSFLEKFIISSEKAKNYFYANFVKKHVKKAYKYYPKLMEVDAVKEMLDEVEAPYKIFVSEDKIKHKEF